jgi:hypothetical protein
VAAFSSAGIKCQAWGHAVKILGWGHDMVNVTTWDVAANKSKHTMQDTQYWIGANSWSRGWGEDGAIRYHYHVDCFDSTVFNRKIFNDRLPRQARDGQRGGRLEVGKTVFFK